MLEAMADERFMQLLTEIENLKSQLEDEQNRHDTEIQLIQVQFAAEGEALGKLKLWLDILYILRNKGFIFYELRFTFEYAMYVQNAHVYIYVLQPYLVNYSFLNFSNFEYLSNNIII